MGFSVRSLWRPVFLGALLFLVLATGIWGPGVYRTVLLGSGFMAQSLCAGIFVSGREAKDVLAQELSGPRYELLRFFQPTIDREQKRVRASLYGLGSRTSIFREGLGCTLVIGTTEDALRAEARGLLTDPGWPAPGVLWPGGERVDLAALPDGIDEKALKEPSTRSSPSPMQSGHGGRGRSSSSTKAASSPSAMRRASMPTCRWSAGQ